MTAPAIGSAPRLGAYIGIGAAGLIASLVAGRPALAAFGAPLLLVAAVGVCLARRPELTHGPARLIPTQAMVGDRLRLELDVQTRPTVGRLDVLVDTRGPIEVEQSRSGRCGWAIVDPAPAGAANPLRAELSTLDWGRAATTATTVRAYGPLGLVHWTWRLTTPSSARVLPRPEQLRSLLDPLPRATAGSHASRARGSGLDFAELRALAPGDRLTDVNWRASARRSGAARPLLVNVRHPDRAGDVVLLLDTSADADDERAPWLPLAARAAWAVALAHLQSSDRVGLVTFGGYTSWIGVRGGERAGYALLDKLLGARPAAGANRSLAWLPLRLIPADAAVMAVTPLHALHAVDALVELRRRGRPVTALLIDTADLLPADPALDPARQFWALELERRARLLTAAGIVTARWRPEDPLAGALALLARMARPLTRPPTGRVR